MAKGVVQEKEIPRLFDWLKSAKREQRDNYVNVFNQIREGIEAGNRSLWVSRSCSSSSMFYYIHPKMHKLGQSLRDSLESTNFRMQ